MEEIGESHPMAAGLSPAMAFNPALDISIPPDAAMDYPEKRETHLQAQMGFRTLIFTFQPAIQFSFFRNDPPVFDFQLSLSLIHI